MADYLADNLEHVRRWLRSDGRAHDWRAFGRHVLECEGVHAPTEQQIGLRERLVRDRVTRCLRADAGRERPLYTPQPPRYDLLLSCYCAESATGDKRVRRQYLRNILGLLAPGGLFITAALRRCRSYRLGHERIACADIDEQELAAVLFEAGMEPAQLQLEVHRVGLRERLGYDSIILAAARSPPRRCWSS